MTAWAKENDVSAVKAARHTHAVMRTVSFHIPIGFAIKKKG